MAIPSSFLDELVSRSDIVDVVSGYVQLTKRSGSNLFGLCPFHSEKTPSFSVSPDKQIYHCFGCGKGGGVINFIMEIENLQFPDAVHFLARRAGMTVPEDTESPDRQSRRARLLELNRAAARFFYETLSRPEGAAAVDYINRRGISKAMVKRFGLGAAPDSWDALTTAMLNKGFHMEELAAAGLAKRRKGGNGVYDAFRNRLMFPVIDVRGSVIGFSGRILGDGEPKYLNSPDTPVFSKSRNLFALNLAKKTDKGMLLLVEGNIDVVSLHQAGFDCAVASLGTSLTPEQARLMSRYTDNVVICYDSDNAGMKAAQRAIGIFENTGLRVRVLQVDGAKDPDEFIQKNGADAFARLIERSENQIDYRIQAVLSKYKLDTDEGRLGFLAEVTGVLASLSNAVEREVYSAKVAEMTGVDVQAIRTEVRKTIRREIVARKKKQERDAVRPETTGQPRDRSLRYDNIASAKSEEGIVRLLLADPALLTELDGFYAGEFTSAFLGKVFQLIRARYAEGRPISLASLSPELESAEASQLAEIMEMPVSLSNGVSAMRDYVEKIRMEKMKTTDRDDLLTVRNKLREKKGYGG